MSLYDKSFETGQLFANPSHCRLHMEEFREMEEFANRYDADHCDH